MGRLFYLSLPQLLHLQSRNKNSPSHLTTIKMAIIKKQKISIGKDVEKLEILCSDGRNVKWCSLYGKRNSGSLKYYTQNYYMIHQSYFSVYAQNN